MFPARRAPIRMKFAALWSKLETLAATAGTWTQPVLLLLVRGWWGWSFFVAGKGKLMNLGQTKAFFTELGLPLPQVNAFAAGAVECGGGLLLLAGLGARLASVPLMATMAVAYATAHRAEASALLAGEPDKFTEAAPFLFLLASAIVFAFGPGRLSLDAVLGRK